MWIRNTTWNFTIRYQLQNNSQYTILLEPVSYLFGKECLRKYFIYIKNFRFLDTALRQDVDKIFHTCLEAKNLVMKCLTASERGLYMPYMCSILTSMFNPLLQSELWKISSYKGIITQHYFKPKDIFLVFSSLHAISNILIDYYVWEYLGWRARPNVDFLVKWVKQ